MAAQDNNAPVSFHLTICELTLLTFTYLFYHLFSKWSDYRECITWCEGLYDKIQVHNLHEVQRILTTCAHRSNNIFRVVMKIVFVAVAMAALETAIKSGFNGMFTPHIPVQFPWLPKESPLNGLACIVCLFCSLFPLILSTISIFGVIAVTVEHFILGLNVIHVLLKSLRTPFTDQTFYSLIRTCTVLHCELIAQRHILVGLTSSMVLIFELSAYVAILMIWLIVFHLPGMLLVAISGIALSALFVLLCWINERLGTAIDDCSHFLYELDWNCFKPEHRRTLVQMKIFIDKPRILMAGKFHPVSFVNLRRMLDRVYRFGVVLNKVL